MSGFCSAPAATNCTDAPKNTNPASNVGYTCDKELADGSVCKAKCAEGYSGSGLEATCTNTQWSLTGTCDPNRMFAGRESLPKCILLGTCTHSAQNRTRHSTVQYSLTDREHASNRTKRQWKG